MTRINLFPSQRAAELEKRRRLRIEMQVGLGAIAVILVVCVIVTFLFDRATNEVDEVLQVQQAHLRFLENRVKDIKQFEIHQKNLQDYQQVIQQQLSRQREPIRLLDTISHNVDSLALWLVRLQVDQQVVHLDGFAVSRKDVARFAKRLKQTPFFQSIKVFETRAERNANRVTYAFTIVVRLKDASYTVATSL
ncbi:MAG: hypothetical protein GKS05_01780 [Nitrospirales bacterium]|nr:hypothetical protein [Nitrospirales bacterium]